MWELDYEESWVPKNWCFWTVVLEKTLESLGLQGEPTRPSWGKSVLSVQSSVLEGLMLKLKLQYFGHLMRRADSLEKTLMWERLRTGGEGDDGRWDGWMASLSRWTWVWVNSGSCWWAGRRPDVPQSMGSQTVGHDWMTEMNWTEMPKIEVTLFIDCSLPGSSIHCIFQARILDSVAISFYVKSSQPRDWTQVSLIVSRCFTIWATREVSQINKVKLKRKRNWQS